MKKIILSFVVLVCSMPAFAQRGRSSMPAEVHPLSWDLGFGFGSYSGHSYSELDLGLNYRFIDHFNWRNQAWGRLGDSFVSAAGVDSSLRWEYIDRDRDGSGLHFYAGPGARISSAQYTGVFAEAGISFRMGGFTAGVGVKEINYFSPAKDPSTGQTANSQDTILMLILGGGGPI